MKVPHCFIKRSGILGSRPVDTLMDPAVHFDQNLEDAFWGSK